MKRFSSENDFRAAVAAFNGRIIERVIPSTGEMLPEITLLEAYTNRLSTGEAVDGWAKVGTFSVSRNRGSLDIE